MNRITGSTVALSLGIAAFAVHAGAATVAFTQTPLSNVVAQLNKEYSINIVIKGALTQTPARPVTFSVSDPATRLQVVNALANAAGADFQKGYVVSKTAPGVATPPVDIDSNGFVVFKSTTVSAVDAITAVATTDNATVQISPDVTGTVVLSATTLRTADAAREIARQTHTRWRTYYALMPLGTSSGGRVVDRTSTGQPITQDSFTYYGSKTRPQPPTANADGSPASMPADPNGTPGTVPPGTTAMNPQNAANAPGGPYGNYSPYNYNAPFNYGYGAPNGYGSPYGYGSDPYSSPYFSYNTGPAYGPNGQLYQQTTGGLGYGGFSGNGVSILPGAGNYGPFGGYGGSPVTIGGFGGY